MHTNAPTSISASTSPEVLKVLRNTYTLLAMTITFSAVMAAVSMALNVPYLGLWMLIPYFICLFAVTKTQNSAAGLFWVFALTGWLGFTLGPILNFYISMSGYEPVFLALGGTAFIFFSLSAFILITRKDLSGMTGFLMTGIIVAFIAAIANLFLQISSLHLVISCVFLLLSSGLIMWQTSQIVHGGETNYISATVTLFVMLYNIFTILLSFLGGEE
ncbi:MAG: Bax inhibitor-1/YccA family protein [Pseudomonadales bacterium]|nr:Bax inhibitor-1/YccA family protein [Pseudomonadales bacterium]